MAQYAIDIRHDVIHRMNQSDYGPDINRSFHGSSIREMDMGQPHIV